MTHSMELIKELVSNLFNAKNSALERQAFPVAEKSIQKKVTFVFDYLQDKDWLQDLLPELQKARVVFSVKDVRDTFDSDSLLIRVFDGGADADYSVLSDRSPLRVVVCHKSAENFKEFQESLANENTIICGSDGRGGTKVIDPSTCLERLLEKITQLAPIPTADTHKEKESTLRNPKTALKLVVFSVDDLSDGEAWLADLLVELRKEGLLCSIKKVRGPIDPNCVLIRVLDYTDRLESSFLRDESHLRLLVQVKPHYDPSQTHLLVANMRNNILCAADVQRSTRKVDPSTCLPALLKAIEELSIPSYTSS